VVFEITSPPQRTKSGILEPKRSKIFFRLTRVVKLDLNLFATKITITGPEKEKEHCWGITRDSIVPLASLTLIPDDRRKDRGTATNGNTAKK